MSAEDRLLADLHRISRRRSYVQAAITETSAYIHKLRSELSTLDREEVETRFLLGAVGRPFTNDMEEDAA